MNKLLAFLTILFFTSPSFANNSYNSTSLATGSSGLAAVEPGSSMYLNPATLYHLKGRYFLSSFGKDFWGVSLSENLPDTTLPAGMSYVEKKIENNQYTNPTIYKDFRLSIADYTTKKISLGITAHHVQYLENNENFKYWNADLGLIYTPKRYLGVALVFYDRLAIDPNIPDSFKVAPKTAVGVNFLYHQFLRIRADLLSQDYDHFEKPTLMAGLESFLNQWTAIRLGTKYDSSINKQYFSAGAGFIGPQFHLQYGFEKLSDSNENTLHTVDLGVPF